MVSVVTFGYFTSTTKFHAVSLLLTLSHLALEFGHVITPMVFIQDVLLGSLR